MEIPHRVVCMHTNIWNIIYMYASNPHDYSLTQRCGYHQNNQSTIWVVDTTFDAIVTNDEPVETWHATGNESDRPNEWNISTKTMVISWQGSAFLNHDRDC